METIKFYIARISSDMCRIIPNGNRDTFKKIAEGGCICSLEVMLDEMEHITKECEKIGFLASFEW